MISLSLIILHQVKRKNTLVRKDGNIIYSKHLYLVNERKKDRKREKKKKKKKKKKKRKKNN